MEEAEKSINAKSIAELNKVQQEFKKNSTEVKPSVAPKPVAQAQAKPVQVAKPVSKPQAFAPKNLTKFSNLS